MGYSFICLRSPDPTSGNTKKKSTVLRRYTAVGRNILKRKYRRWKDGGFKQDSNVNSHSLYL
jgi:hypothetical protein